jgi:hypothetical protein
MDWNQLAQIGRVSCEHSIEHLSSIKGGEIPDHQLLKDFVPCRELILINV